MLLWQGLDPPLFWHNIQTLLRASPPALDGLIRDIVHNHAPEELDLSHENAQAPSLILFPITKVLGVVSVVGDPITYNGIHVLAAFNGWDSVIFIDFNTSYSSSFNEHPQPADVSASPNPENILCIPITQETKHPSGHLSEVLSRSVAFAHKHIRSRPMKKIVIAGNHGGTDIVVGIAVALLQFEFDGEGRLRNFDLSESKDNLHLTGRSTLLFVVYIVFSQPLSESDPTFWLSRHSQTTKKSLRIRLQWIQASFSRANPSRSTLKRVNEFFMSSEYRRSPAMSTS